MSTETYLLAAIAVLLTGISKSGFAGGLGILGVPLISLTLPPQAAATILLPLLIAIDVMSVWRYRASWELRTVRSLLPGAAVGIALGMAGFTAIDTDALRMLVGVLALLFVVRFARSSRAPQPARAGTRPWTVFVASLVSGFAGFVAHAGGPPIKGTFLRMGLDKAAFVGTNAVFFFMLNVAKAGGYGALGLFSPGGLLASLSLVPFLLLGVFAGFALHDHIPQTRFMRLAYIFLAIAGLNLIGTGVASVLQGAG